MYDIGNSFRIALNKIGEIAEHAPSNDVKQLPAATREALNALEQKLRSDYDSAEINKRR